MMRFWISAVAMLLLGASAALAQSPTPQAPNSTTLCPVTHDCRPVGQGAQSKTVVPQPASGAIQCPPGTYQIQGTNKCRVK